MLTKNFEMIFPRWGTAARLRRRPLQKARKERMDVKTIAVVGAGTMGRGIAYAAAFGGYNYGPRR